MKKSDAIILLTASKPIQYLVLGLVVCGVLYFIKKQFYSCKFEEIKKEGS